MRIVIADNGARVRAGLMVIAPEINISVIAEVSQVEALLDYVAHSVPDVVLLSWELTGLLPEIHLPALRLFGHGCKIIVISKDSTEQYRAMAAGADSFLSMEHLSHYLLNAIYSVKRINYQGGFLLTT